MTQIVCNLLIDVVTVVHVLLSCLFLCTLQGMLSITTTTSMWWFKHCRSLRISAVNASYRGGEA